MKKIILLVMLGIGTFFVFSCTKSCTCVNPDTGVLIEEIEVDPSDSCSAHSNSSSSCS